MSYILGLFLKITINIYIIWTEKQNDAQMRQQNDTYNISQNAGDAFLQLGNTACQASLSLQPRSPKTIYLLQTQIIVFLFIFALHI